MFLIINTTLSDKIFIALSRGDDLISKKIISAKYKQAEKLLPAIEKLLKDNVAPTFRSDEKRIKGVEGLKDLRGIIVAKGPGSFTSLRVGVVTANTLAFALDVPVIGMRAGEFENLEGLIKKGIKRLKKIKLKKIVIPFY